MTKNNEEIYVKIIYYCNDNKNDTLITDWSFSSKMTMISIKQYFERFLMLQRSAVNLCFGKDIGEMIINYMPNLFHSKNNSFYTHIHVGRRRLGLPFFNLKKIRYKLSNNLNLKNVLDLKLNNSSDKNANDELVLRLRYKELENKYYTNTNTRYVMLI